MFPRELGRYYSLPRTSKISGSLGKKNVSSAPLTTTSQKDMPRPCSVSVGSTVPKGSHLRKETPPNPQNLSSNSKKTCADQWSRAAGSVAPYHPTPLFLPSQGICRESASSAGKVLNTPPAEVVFFGQGDKSTRGLNGEYLIALYFLNLPRQKCKSSPSKMKGRCSYSFICLFVILSNSKFLVNWEFLLNISNLQMRCTVQSKQFQKKNP